MCINSLHLFDRQLLNFNEERIFLIFEERCLPMCLFFTTFEAAGDGKF